jgi:hypothetical protein
MNSQVINKKDESAFTKQDEDILTTLLNIAGPMLEHSSFFTQPPVRLVQL